MLSWLRMMISYASGDGGGCDILIAVDKKATAPALMSFLSPLFINMPYSLSVWNCIYHCPRIQTHSFPTGYNYLYFSLCPFPLFLSIFSYSSFLISYPSASIKAEMPGLSSRSRPFRHSGMNLNKTPRSEAATPPSRRWHIGYKRRYHSASLHLVLGTTQRLWRNMGLDPVSQEGLIATERDWIS